MKFFKGNRLGQTIVVDLILALLALSFIAPLVLMISTAFKTPEQSSAYPPSLIPNPFSLRSFQEALSGGKFYQYLSNTVFITFMATLGTLISSSLVAFGFARLRCRHKKFWFTLMLSTMMIPSTITLIPMYSMYAKMGIIDSFLPLILPFFFGGSAYSIFLLRQFFLAIPAELSEAAFLDGCSWLDIFARIYIPNAKPALIVVTIFSFVSNWNDFFNPMIYLSSPEKFTISIGLAEFKKMYGGAMDLGPLMSMSLLCVIPLIVLYLLCQKYFVEGIVTTGIKA
jgi:ABC-type glycerol-3-phosphate transport system permease component